MRSGACRGVYKAGAGERALFLSKVTPRGSIFGVSALLAAIPVVDGARGDLEPIPQGEQTPPSQDRVDAQTFHVGAARVGGTYFA